MINVIKMNKENSKPKKNQHYYFKIKRRKINHPELIVYPNKTYIKLSSQLPLLKINRLRQEAKHNQRNI